MMHIYVIFIIIMITSFIIFCYIVYNENLKIMDEKEKHKEENQNINKKSQKYKVNQINMEYKIPNLSEEKENCKIILSELQNKIKLLETSLMNVKEDWENYDWEINKSIDDKEYYLKCKIKTTNKLKEYNEAIDSPYFGRLIVESENGIDDLYIGQKTLSDSKSNIIVYDWRSNVCSLYYANEIKNKVALPNKTIEFNTLLKRRIQILNKKFIDASDIFVKNGNNKIYDEFLNKVLEIKKISPEFSDIIETIQSWQNEIIRDEINCSILCQGVAGCGKTAIILHRLSYLLFNYPNVKYDNYLILCPSKLFKENIGNLNVKLGINQIPMMTINEYYWIKLEPFLSSKYKYKEENIVTDNSYIEYIYNIIKNKYINFITTNCKEEYRENNNIYSQIKNIHDTAKSKIKEDESFEKFVNQLFNKDTSLKNINFENLLNKAYCEFSNTDEYENDFNGQAEEKIKELKDIETIDSNIIENFENLYKYAKSNFKNIGKEKYNETLYRIYLCLKNKKTYVKSFDSKKSKEELQNILENKIFYLNKRSLNKIKFYQEIVNESTKYLNIENVIDFIIDLTKTNDIYKTNNKNINSNTLKMILYSCSKLGFKINFKSYKDIKKNIIRSFQYIFIDEAQNLDKYDISTINNLESPISINLYGDINQNMNTIKKNWNDIISPINRNLKKYNINYNYRNTVEVVKYCNKNLNMDIQAIGPIGNPVMDLKLSNDFKELLNYTDYTFITDNEKVYNYLKNNNKKVYNVQEVKGMEFKNIIVINSNMNIAQQYVSYTRTLNDLIVYKYHNNELEINTNINSINNLNHNNNISYELKNITVKNKGSKSGKFKIKYLDDENYEYFYYNIAEKEDNIFSKTPIFDELFSTEIGKVNKKNNFIMIDKIQYIPQISNNTHDLKIHYLTKYIPKKYNKYDENTERILDLKNRSTIAIKYYSKLVYDWLNNNNYLNNNSMIAVIPKHEASENNISGTADVAKIIINKCDISDGINLILRKTTISKKSTSLDRPTYNIDQESLDINKLINIENKNIILLDDVTTTGNSFKAASELLYKNGAQNVVALAIGKTVNPYE